MGRGKPDYSWAELMAIVLARDFRDGELALAGGARSEVAVAACLLAQHLHAPNLTLITTGLFVNPHPKALCFSGPDYRYHRGCEAFGSFYDVFELSENGRLGFFCYNGIQMDKYGNVNLHFIGDPQKPQVRGPGLVNLSFGVTAARFYLYPMEHTTRNFVEKVDYISIPGYIDGPEGRARAGIKTKGPGLCVSPLGVFDFEETTKRMRVRSIHEWVSLEEVVQNTGFELLLPGQAPTTPPPSLEELEVLRNLVDTEGILRRG